MKGKAVAAVLGGSLLILSSAAHAFLGWPAISAALKETNATAELTTDLSRLKRVMPFTFTRLPTAKTPC